MVNDDGSRNMETSKDFDDFKVGGVEWGVGVGVE